MSDKTQKEFNSLNAVLHAFTDVRCVLSEAEEQTRRRLEHISTEGLEGEQRTHLHAEGEGMNEAQLQATLEAVETENDQLKRQMAVLNRDAEQKNSEQLQHLEKVRESLQHITNLSESQQRKITCLQDEISAAQQLAIETQIRQLEQVEHLTDETRQLKETLTAMQRQQQPSTKERHRGKHNGTSLSTQPQTDTLTGPITIHCAAASAQCNNTFLS